MSNIQKITIFIIISLLACNKNISRISTKDSTVFIDIAFTIADKKYNKNDSTWTLILKAKYSSPARKPDAMEETVSWDTIPHEIVIDDSSPTTNQSSFSNTRRKVFKDEIIGFKLVIKDNMPIGTWQEFTYIREGIVISSIGKESDNFIDVISDLYGFPTTKKFTKGRIDFASYSLTNKVANLQNDKYKFALLHDYQMNNLAYDYVVWLVTDFPNNQVVFAEKECPGREKMIEIFTR